MSFHGNRIKMTWTKLHFVKKCFQHYCVDDFVSFAWKRTSLLSCNRKWKLNCIIIYQWQLQEKICVMFVRMSWIGHKVRLKYQCTNNYIKEFISWIVISLPKFLENRYVCSSLKIENSKTYFLSWHIIIRLFTW